MTKVTTSTHNSVACGRSLPETSGVVASMRMESNQSNLLTSTSHQSGISTLASVHVCVNLGTPEPLEPASGVTNDPLKRNLFYFPCISTAFPSDRWDSSSSPHACGTHVWLQLRFMQTHTHVHADPGRRYGGEADQSHGVGMAFQWD